MREEPDSALLRRWVEGRDSEAFAELVTRYSGLVFAACLRILRSASDAEDATQDCFATLASTGATPGAYLGPWLHRVATNHSLTRLRGDTRRRRRETAYANTQQAPVDAKWDEIHVHIDEAIAELPEKLRDPIVAHFLQGRAQNEIAASLGVARQTVASRMEKGIDLLRKSLHRRGVSITATGLAAAMTANFSDAVTVPATLADRLSHWAHSDAVRLARPHPPLYPVRHATWLSAGAVVAIITGIAIYSGMKFTGNDMRVATLDVHRSTDTSEPPAAPAPTPRASSAPLTEATPPNSKPAIFDGIQGRIVDSKTGEPRNLGVVLSGEITGGDERHYPSNPDGSFRIDDTSLGYGTFAVSVKNYQFYPFVSVEGIRRDGEATPEIVLRVSELATISGRVLLADGTPAGGASIMRRELGGNIDTLATAESNGAYVVHHDGGHWQLSAHVGYLQSEESNFEIAPDQSIEHDFVLPESGTITIDVFTSDDKVIDDISTSTVMTDAMTSPFLLADRIDDHRFVVENLPYDVYQFEIRARRYQSGMIREVTLDATNPIATVSVQLQPAQLYTLAVRVVDAEGRPVPDAGVAIEEIAERVDASGAPQAIISTATASDGKNTDAHGVWLAENIPAGRYRAYCNDARGNGEVLGDVPDERTVTLQLEKRTGVYYRLELTDTATGTVLSPIDAHVFVVGPDGTLGDELTIGENRFFVIKEGYTAFQETIVVGTPPPKDGVDIHATLAEGGAITGLVTDSDGIPQPGQSLHAFPEDLWPIAQANWSDAWRNFGSAIAQGARSDATGSFTLTYLPEGNYVVALANGECTPALETKPGFETVPVTLQMRDE